MQSSSNVGTRLEQASSLVKTAAQTIKDTQPLKTERSNQKKKISEIEKGILSLKEDLQDRKPLTKSQKEILKRTEDASKKLIADKKAIRAEIRDFGKKIDRSLEKMNSHMKEIVSEANKLANESTVATDPIELASANIQKRSHVLSNKKNTLDEKLQTLQADLKEVRFASQARLKLSILIHEQIDDTKEKAKYFSKEAGKLKGSSIPNFDSQMKELNRKRDELKKIQDKLETTPIKYKEDQKERIFFQGSEQKFKALQSEIKTLEKEIQTSLTAGIKKTTVRERIKKFLVKGPSTETITPPVAKVNAREELFDKMLRVSMEGHPSDRIPAERRLSIVYNRSGTKDYKKALKELNPAERMKFQDLEVLKRDFPDLFRKAYEQYLNTL